MRFLRTTFIAAIVCMVALGAFAQGDNSCGNAQGIEGDLVDGDDPFEEDI